MRKSILLLVAALGLAASAVHAEEPPPAALREGETEKSDKASAEGPKLVGGMSIVGNDEAPKSLAIVPWKESSLGETLDFNGNLGDGRKPLDKEVFLRELSYYRIRVGSE